VLGKPASKAEACDMLRRLSGRTHQVLTGYCICHRGRAELFTDTVSTDVLFKTLDNREIEWYVVTGEPFDKAGAYAIQGIGTFLVKSINGSFTNVVGLPVCEVVEFLMRKQVIGFDSPPPPALYESVRRAELE
jgi:septum formation protein